MKVNPLVLCLVAAALAPLAREAAAEGPIKNGLSNVALRRNTLTTNQHALELLRGHALDDQLLSIDNGHIAKQLGDPRAQAMMKEIVRCALKKGSVTYEGVTWRGELGLCERGDGPGAPRWDAGGASEACQQLVTACVMARVNALHKAVPISLRGEPAALFPPRDPLSTETRFRESPTEEDPSEGTPIHSFAGPLCGPGPECNWSAAFVGRCQSGPVSLALEHPSACASAKVRICAGIHGCYAPTSPDKPPFNPSDPHAYGRWVKDSAGACSGLQVPFGCPVDLGGYYSVMTQMTPPPGGPGGGSTDPRPAHAPPVALVQAAGSGSYPATEHQVFTFREGAFYGNLFEPDALSWDCSVTADGTRSCTRTDTGASEICSLSERVAAKACVEPKALPYRNVYACYSLAQQLDSQGTGDDDLGVSYLNDRICDEATPDKPCFFHRPRRCHFADSDKNEQFGAHCAWQSTGGIYQSCESLDGQHKQYLPITTYLNDLCDLLDSDDLCRRVRGSLAPGVRRPDPPRCGCSSDGVDGGLAALVPLVVASLAIRRRARSARSD